MNLDKYLPSQYELMSEDIVPCRLSHVNLRSLFSIGFETVFRGPFRT